MSAEVVVQYKGVGITVTEDSLDRYVTTNHPGHIAITHAKRNEMSKRLGDLLISVALKEVTLDEYFGKNKTHGACKHCGKEL